MQVAECARLVADTEELVREHWVMYARDCVAFRAATREFRDILYGLDPDCFAAERACTRAARAMASSKNDLYECLQIYSEAHASLDLAMRCS
jgi:hypothetical protein